MAGPLDITQPFYRQVDYTALTTVDGGQLNQGWDTLIPTPGALIVPQVGIGMVVTTQDFDDGSPNTPDAGVTVMWKRFLWNRLASIIADPSGRGIIYSWNDSYLNPDPALLKWFDTRADISQLQTDVALALTNSTTALATANTANTNASTALTDAENAVTTANTATDSAATANVNATAAAASATTANTAANNAQATATSAAAVAAAATSAANANKLVTQITAGLAGQQIRTNSTATANEYFNVKDTIAILQNVQAQNTAGEGITAGGAYTTRVLNTKITDSGVIVTALAANQFTLAAGSYLIKAIAPKHSTTTMNGYLVIYNITDAGVSIFGKGNAQAASVGANQVDEFVEGIVTIASAKVFELRSLDNSGATLTGGAAMNIAGVSERYSQVFIQKIG